MRIALATTKTVTNTPDLIGDAHYEVGKDLNSKLLHNIFREVKPTVKETIIDKTCMVSSKIDCVVLSMKEVNDIHSILNNLSTIHHSSALLNNIVKIKEILTT